MAMTKKIWFFLALLSIFSQKKTFKINYILNELFYKNTALPVYIYIYIYKLQTDVVNIVDSSDK